MGVKFISASSGSSGNSYFIYHNNAGILIDCGASSRAVDSAVSRCGASLSKIAAVFVTHEHTDHIKSIDVFAKSRKIPVISNKDTLLEISRKNPLIPQNAYISFPTGSTLSGGEFEVTSFKTMHDTVESIGFVIKAGDKKIAVATDLGCITTEVEQALLGCDLVVIESNYDREMLISGRYPDFLKRRVMGKYGHLCNDDCAGFASKLVKSGCTHIMLGHLSKDNNTPQAALECTKRAFELENIRCQTDVRLSAAPRLTPSEVIEL